MMILWGNETIKNDLVVVALALFQCNTNLKFHQIWSIESQILSKVKTSRRYPFDTTQSGRFVVE